MKVAILNTRTTIKLDDPHANEFWNDELVAYVIRMKDTTRVVTSWGHLASFGQLRSVNEREVNRVQVGDVLDIHSDQSARFMGYGTVVGIRPGSLADAIDNQGDVPADRMNLWVAK